MKIALPTTEKDLDSPLDSRFGRTSYFLIYDTEGEIFRIVDNQQILNSPQGAGIQAAENLAREKIDCLITVHCGPKAYRVLSAAGIKVFHTDESSVRMALEAWKNGKLTEADSANVEGHWV
ncbi:MAG TPA: NifB/NifX family molybdenum-iron cluster-binding protein [Thermoanaerobaculia bacterium]|nr:NifB/NifX family molybdenum-iron cluster-binding protein [Thermoanaerobaculia bacterium]HUM30120.1 NifB/NifX family molybdenum-iron cluster-binding protein [Thermoanaerobaculia bacterium]HXK68817.1 NifB/NifX family molybdenum-iron cluster-binding protein [Thermoanaerobaculia bacterium]